MSLIHCDGTVLDPLCNLGIVGAAKAAQEGVVGTHMAIIREVIFCDDTRNSTKGTDIEQVEYTCMIAFGKLAGKTVFHVRDCSSNGGIYNASESIKSPPTNINLSDTGQKCSPKDSNGDFVYISFLSGEYSNPVIIGPAKHPKSPIKTKKEDGIRQVSEMNGIRTEITKDGKYIISNTGGPKDSNGNPTKPEAAGGAFALNDDGSMGMERGDQKISMDKEGQVELKGPGNTEMSLKSGGLTEMKSSITNIASKQAMNIKSTLTQIGQSGLPSARIGDIVVGTDSMGGPCISRILNGSFISMVGS